MSVQTIQFADSLRISCTLPIDAAKAKKDLAKRLTRSSQRSEQRSSSTPSVNLDDAAALGNFLFKSN